MLDANLKNTLRSYLQNLKTPVELSLAVDQSEKGQELKALALDIATLSELILVTDNPTAKRVPSMLVRSQAKGTEAGRAPALQAVRQAYALDRFKPVNDTYGHEVGDRLLIEVARRLQSQMREGDLVARLGGDEFVVLLGGRQTPAQLAAMAQRLCEAVQQPLLHAGHLISVDASIGIARCPEHGQTLTELLRHADAAMYRAKQAHSGFAFYEPASASA